ncbi:TM0106 family RecB-like putative nuclease [Nocardioides sp. zg-579]|uniref:TM0106 family RecB-like putative nuclease n=1 Tax=Nocardioides marmotae TaxID=2663857 RepID=A0A6I3IU35_9ACTN|nr:bifunctional RecB family nuclease/DEAD/DEAH box helicase [Nocardioides marmotae]MCR6030349.1 TM0106 family RecB-like putative nuclease [Gordonia jinghuaiqii]MTB93983.1 TM0106 family RecB-like putative nuclease [Nocardioides marmotae]QKE00297.1 TM0106 family RecB-like putative nuclease [Nocardioides marmotae]
MFLLDDRLVWSATDLTAAAECEFAVLSGLDRVLGRAPVVAVSDDPLGDQVAKLGELHEAAEFERLRLLHGDHDPVAGIGMLALSRASGRDLASLSAVAERTLKALSAGADVLYQPAFFDGDFLGYADFVRCSTVGWVVCDTKLARHAKPTALLQLAAYAAQLVALDVPVAPTVELLLGNGRREEFRRADLEPLFRERRSRLLQLLEQHGAEADPVTWGQPGVAACGRCADCERAAMAGEDLVLVAGLRMEQRRKLNEGGVRTVSDLAKAEDPPPGMARSTFERLRAQAEMQLLQKEPDPGEPLVVHHRVIDEKPLRSLPPKSPGDLFFDFEGDPLHNEGDLGDWGLEYLWGVLTAPDHPTEPHDFLPLWADDHQEERACLMQFLDDLTARLEVHPELHVYHYAPYEVTALKRLTAKHKTHEAVLDDLLRGGIFVDLYAVVRAALLISQPSYSIKKLEPLYMEEARSGDVMAGDVSIAEYHSYRLHLERGEAEPAGQARRALLDYNQYDCESTLRLRDWLWGLVDHPEAPLTEHHGAGATGETDEEHDPLAQSLVARSGPVHRSERTAEEQAWAMLASALGYHRRERLPAAWEYFHRLFNPVAEWESGSEVLVFTEPPAVEQDWDKQRGKQTYSRILTATAHVGPGNTVRPGDMSALYADPLPDSCTPHEGATHAIGCGASLLELERIADDLVEVRFEERVRKGVAGHPQLPAALVPGYGVNDKPLEDAIREVASAADAAGALPESPAIDVLVRRSPRLGSDASLPQTGDSCPDLVRALLDLDRSYLAVQGPPGTGKTYTGSHVIRELVETHGWRIGIVGPSHAVVENFLGAVVKTGLDPALVGKKATKTPNAPWQSVKDPAAFVGKAERGCVVGGTAWNFVGTSFERECLDLLVVDEAGQFSLANTLAVSIAAKRLLLLGDPQQLPQVSQGTHGEPVNHSALGWLMDGHAALPPELGYFLPLSYRMHPSVCAPVSTLSYAEELRSAEPASRRRLDGVDPGVRVVRLTHEGNSVASPEEADEVVRQITEVLGAVWTDPERTPASRPLTEDDVVVVAPYNAQRLLISSRLAAAGLDGVRVGTVDKFQGQEAPVVVLSMTASSAVDVPRGIGFLLNRNRVNVGVSRAQYLSIVVRSESLTSFMPATVGGLLELGAFVGLCESGEARSESTSGGGVR